MRQVFEIDLAAARERERSLHQPLELPDVAGPVVGEQRVGRRLRQLEVPRGAMPLQKICGQGHDVCASLAKRWHMHFDS